MEQLEQFNVCALACAKAVARDGKPHTMGMWTVRPAEGTEQQDAGIPSRGEDAEGVYYGRMFLEL